ncbi:hypothetical protein PInf_020044 [Phytophthora infestans]|nr:hypothetical protein PInf_020044 [Phytophthora infestans]
MMATLSSSSVVLAGDPARVKAVEEEDGDYEELIPPENFAMIEKGLYRSGFPKKKNFAFLKKSLQLKSILTLVLEDYPLANTEFNKMHGIKLLQFGVPGNKEPFVDIPEDGIVAALKAVLDKRNHPMLIHCNKGKHRTGCLVGSLRKVQRWAFSSIFDEYIRFSAPKPRMMDQQRKKVWQIIYLTGLACSSSEFD